MKKFLVFGILIIILISGCITKEEIKNISEEGKEKTDKENAIEECIKICKEFKEKGEELDSKCLSNDFYPDYVCDVAHNPRQEIDNKPENQCSAYREGKAHHFVEIDENCTLIRAI